MNESRDRLAELRIDREPDRPRSPVRLLIAVSVALVLAAAAAAWWWARDDSPEVTVAAAVVGPAEGPAAEAVLDASGYVVARLRATVSAKVTGKITEVLIEEGMEVGKGQVLARLDDSLVRRQLELEEAQLARDRQGLRETEVRLEEAKINLRRTRELIAGEVATAAALDADQAAVDALAARLEREREEVVVAERRLALQGQMLADLVIRAPFGGVVVTKDAQPGEMISPVSAGGGFTRTGICTIVDMSSLEIEVDVSETYINRVAPGQRVVATLDAYPDWRIPGRVITPVPTADRQKATVMVRIELDELDPRLLPDMGVKVSFLGAQVESAATVARARVPEKALVEEGGQTVVFVYDAGRVERRAVRVGQRRDGTVEVLSGLSGGEQVVVEGAGELEDGMEVRLRREES